MLSLLNLLAFLAVTGYASYLFVNLVYTRYLFIKLGKKADFKSNLKDYLTMISDGVKAKEVEETVENFAIVDILEKAL